MIRFFVVSFTVVILNAALSDKASVCVCVCVCVCVGGGGGGGVKKTHRGRGMGPPSLWVVPSPSTYLRILATSRSCSMYPSYVKAPLIHLFHCIHP